MHHEPAGPPQGRIPEGTARRYSTVNSVPRDLPQLRRRLRRVMEHIGLALQRPAGALPEPLSLPSLAAVACWSPEHLDRIYRQQIGEPPMATVRRLRLQRAAEELLAAHRLLDVADAAGYASTQAFGRAFQRQFGDVPSRWAEAEATRRRMAAPPAVITLVRVAESHPCHWLNYDGEADGVSAFYDEIVSRLQRSGSPRTQWQVFGIGDAAATRVTSRRPDQRVSLRAAVLAAPLAHRPDGFGLDTIAGGTYARLAARHAARIDEHLHEIGWQRADQTFLRHYDTDPAHTPPPERREWLYVPVARR
jgi:AraC family transcriptional regulator